MMEMNMARRKKDEGNAAGVFLLAIPLLVLSMWSEVCENVALNFHWTKYNVFNLDLNTIYWIVFFSPFAAIIALIIFFKISAARAAEARHLAFLEEVRNNPKLQKMDRMFVYAWEDTNTPGEVKFGDHFENNVTFAQGVRNTKKYIRESLARQKYKYDRGDIIVWDVLDASAYAKRKNKFYKNSKIDDTIRRNVLAHRIGRSEFHKMNGAILVDRVKNEIGYL
jgi:hypothetical protein